MPQLITAQLPPGSAAPLQAHIHAPGMANSLEVRTDTDPSPSRLSAIFSPVLQSLTPTPSSKAKARRVHSTFEHKVQASVQPLPQKPAVEVTCLVDSTHQHTISWDVVIKLPVTVNGKPALLKPGRCNLYTFPKVYFKHLREDKGVVPSEEGRYVLEQVITALLLKGTICTDSDVHNSFSRAPTAAAPSPSVGRDMVSTFEEDSKPGQESVVAAFRDGSAGATPLHAMLVANTVASLQLAMAVYRERPALLTHTHRSKLFDGENALHILCVNSREDELVEAIELAASHLRRTQLDKLFHGQACGMFFSAEPMVYYGSTVIGYAVAFSLRKALSQMLECCVDQDAYPGMCFDENGASKPVIDFNDPVHACRTTGFLPVHVAVANSLTKTLNFLLDLPGLDIKFDDMRARPDTRTQFGSRVAYAMCTPLQVAAKMGDKVMVQYIVRTQSEIQWAWGPVSSYHLNLNGIDSVGETGNDVMELVAMLDAGESTKEMLLDGFMDGLLHKLFLQKYRKCRAAHFTMRFVDLVFLACVFILAVWMKQDPAEVLGVSDRYALDNYLPLIGLITIAPLLEEDLRCSLRWWQIARSGPRDEGSKLLLRERGLLGRLILFCMDFGMLVRWMQSHAMWTKMLGWMVAAFAFVWTMQLKRRAESEWDPSLVTPSDRTDSLCIPLSFVCYIQTQSFFMSILFPFERIGVLYKTVFKMLATDVFSWILLFLIFLLNYGITMIIAYPTFNEQPSPLLPDDKLEPVPSFTNFWSALQSLCELAFLGEPLGIDVLAWEYLYVGDTQASPDTQRTWWKLTAFAVFTVFYLVYIIMALVLLLNLLIAMMGDTYQRTRENATLEWRIDFARRVLRLEIQLEVLHRLGMVVLNCGTKVGRGRSVHWVYEYKSYIANVEGGGTRGARRSMFDAGVEDEAEEDERDDDGPGAGDAATVQATMSTALVRQGTLRSFANFGALQTRKSSKRSLKAPLIAAAVVAGSPRKMDRVDETGSAAEAVTDAPADSSEVETIAMG